jgi:beta-glucanase (GH16 family)
MSIPSYLQDALAHYVEESTRSPLETALPMPQGYSHTTFFDDFSKGLSKWNVRQGHAAKNELSVSTNRACNVGISAAGDLHITGIREAYPAGASTRAYTSGYLDTIGRFSQLGGRWEINCALPAAKGVWPAFWLRSDDEKGTKVPGEIDIFEAVGGRPNIVQTVHQSTDGPPGDKLGFDWTPPTGWKYSDFHLYAFEWDAVTGCMSWHIDDTVTRTCTVDDSGQPSGRPAAWLNGPAFRTPANMRLNLQIGGGMPTWYRIPVDPAITVFPGFQVKYVRVLSK